MAATLAQSGRRRLSRRSAGAGGLCLPLWHALCACSRLPSCKTRGVEGWQEHRSGNEERRSTWAQLTAGAGQERHSVRPHPVLSAWRGACRYAWRRRHTTPSTCLYCCSPYWGAAGVTVETTLRVTCTWAPTECGELLMFASLTLPLPLLLLLRAPSCQLLAHRPPPVRSACRTRGSMLLPGERWCCLLAPPGWTEQFKPGWSLLCLQHP